MLRNLLEAEHSKKQTLKIVRFIGNDQKRFDELISFVFGKDERLAQVASWPLMYAVENNPTFIKKHLKNVLKQLRIPAHAAIRRHLLRMMEYFEMPPSLEAECIDICFELLNKKDEFVAVKVFAMEQLSKLTKKYPELKEELKSSIETQLPYETAAFRSRAKKVFKKIQTK